MNALQRAGAWLWVRGIAPERVLSLAMALALAAVAAWPTEADARAGGGHSFGGGSRGGGGSSRSFGGRSSSHSSYGRSHGGGSSDEDLVGLLVWMLFRHPTVGVPTIGLLLFFTWRHHRARFPSPGPAVRVHGTPTMRPPDLSPLRRTDPQFSLPAFLDFTRLVVTRAHTARGRDAWDTVDAWLSPSAHAMLSQRPAHGVTDIVIGATQLVRVTQQDGRIVMHVRVESNLVEGGTQRHLVEAWTFSRSATVVSPVPGQLRALACPSCASPLERLLDGRCASCGNPVRGEAHLWTVLDVHATSQRDLSGVELHLGGGMEVGTDLPTVLAPDLRTAQQAFSARHPEAHWPVLRQRFMETFLAIQKAWGDMRWEQARPLETDALFQQHRHWIERYRKEGLRNRCEDVVVSDVVLCKLDVDAYYECVTVRIFATMRDWTETRSGEVVGGSRTEPRIFSEYWTFLRSAGASAAPRADLHRCPSCAGALDRVAESGRCGYCDALITGGDFDWVLSDIQQDEVYRG